MVTGAGRSPGGPLGVEVHDAVDLGCLTEGTTDEHAGFVVAPVDEHGDLRAHEGVACGTGDGLLHVLAFAQPLPHHVLRHRVRERCRGRAVLTREREESGPVELRGLEEREQRIVLQFVLTGKPDDERRPERGVGLLRADGFDHGQEALAAPPPLHRAQQRGIGVLQREVEVRNDGGELEHRRDQRVAHFARVEVEEPDALETVRCEPIETAQQRCQRPRLARVAPVPREVLRDQHDLGDAAVDQAAHLGFDRLRCARPLLAAERRDGAERAGAVAALGDLHVGPGHGGRGPR